MNSKYSTLLLVGWSMATPCILQAQGTFVYDQQSATNGLATHGNSIQSLQPIGQSFTPASAFIGFVQLQFLDGSPNNSGVTVSVTLLENSITGNELGTTVPVILPDGFIGSASLMFGANVPVTPGTQYFLRPRIESGDASFSVLSDQYGYGGGSAIFLGQPDPSGKDLWFREGYFVPEPAATSLALLGTLAMLAFRRKPMG